MDALEAILTRHSVTDIKPDPIPRNLIEKLLEAAVQAPNHYKVRPWRFVVLTGKSRNALGDIMAEVLKKEKPDLPDVALTKERSKPLRTPVLIAVGVDKPDDPRVLEIENICAAAAAVENLLVAANAMGLGAKWRTGSAARQPEVKEFLGFDRDQVLVSFVYLGYPDHAMTFMERPSFEDRTVWME
jgi:nitroreductase